jgi:quercetin dioxygenase-like cupin family protein
MMKPQNTEPKSSLSAKFCSSPNRFFITVTLLLPLFVAVDAVSADETKPGLIRTKLMENAVELPSKSVNAKVIRVTFPPAFKTPQHTHEGPGPRYVVKGKFEVTQDGKVERFSTGEVFWESGKVMTIQNISAETAELIIFEMAPEH